MTQAYLIHQGLEEFAAAREQFSHLIGELQSAPVLGMEHGDVEALISREGTELLRRLLQGHLDLRSAREHEREAVTGSDGVARSRCREGCARDLMSVFGAVQIRRRGYGTLGVSSVFPLDAELNLPADKYSHGLRQRVAQEVAKGSFDAAVQSIERGTGGKVPKRQAETVSVEISQDFEAFYASRQASEPEATADPLVLSEDGTGIVMRPEGLREGTRKAAERSRHKLKTRLSRGEKKNRKRMAMVAAVYSVAPQIRSAEAVMGLETESPERAPRARARNKRVWASVERDPSVVTAELFAEAQRRDPEQRRPWVMLVDGHVATWPRGRGDAPQRDPTGTVQRAAGGGGRLRGLLARLPRHAALRRVSRSGLADRHRGHRRGLSAPGQGPDGPHRCPLGSATCRGGPQAALAAIER